MTERQTGNSWRHKNFLLRLLASYLVIPIVPPVLLLLVTRSSEMPLSYWLGIVVIHGIFGFAAMVLLGTPLLFFFLRLHWTGFVPFMAGGGLCAGITSYTVLRGGGSQNMVVIFTLFGGISGALFRMTLFSLKRQ